MVSTKKRRYFVIGLTFSIFFQLINPALAKNDLKPAKEVTLRSNSVGIDALVYKVDSKPLVHGQIKDLLIVSERESGKIQFFKIIGKTLSFQSEVKIRQDLDKILILDIYSSDTSRTYVSYVDYSESRGSCGVTKISVIDNLKSQRLLFKSQPCLSGVGAWSEVAGRMTGNGNFLFMTGGNIFLDLYKNKYPRPGLCCEIPGDYQKAMNSTNLYGKVVQVNLKTLQSKIFASGFRGPQGIAWDKYRNLLWETEHGPQGGDELNSILKDKDYGWPFVTYGIPYNPSDDNGSQGLPKKTLYGTHQGYTEPNFYWTPSVAPSQLAIIAKDSPFFRVFPNNLIISTLKDKSLISMSLTRKGSVKSTERIEVNARIRDIESSTIGLTVSTDSGEIVILYPNYKVDLVGPYPPKE
jgi:hypothetical protein